MKQVKWTETDYDYRIEFTVWPQRAKRHGDYAVSFLPIYFTESTDMVITKNGKRVPILKSWDNKAREDTLDDMRNNIILLDNFQIAPKEIAMSVPIEKDIKLNKRKVKYYIYYNKK